MPRLRRGRPANHVVRRGHRDSRGLRSARRGLRRHRAWLRARARHATHRARVGCHRRRGPHRRTGRRSAGHRSEISFEMLERIHRGKTGALFIAAATAGALTAGAPRDAIASLAAVRQEPRAGVSDHRRPARRRRRSGRHGKAVREDVEEDDVRVVQRRGRSAAARHRALSHGGPRACAVRPRAPTRLRELSAFVAARTG